VRSPSIKSRLPEQFAIGDDIDWNAPWADANLWVELPFWLMVNNGSITIDYHGCNFPISMHDNYFELHCDGIGDSKSTVLYRGPFKKSEQLSEDIQKLFADNPALNALWRKCKTTLKIKSRCNEAVLESGKDRPSHSIYLAELCRAHLPIVNHLVQSYRLATYDYFAFEVAPWDVPHWLVERAGQSVSCMIVPYRAWDAKPLIFPKSEGPPVQYQLIAGRDLANQLSAVSTLGEFELLDALNLMERGDYSGAVRRIATAIEVVVETEVKKAVEAADGKAAAQSFIKKTRNDFPSRLTKYEKVTKRILSPGLHNELTETRKLRHRIVHEAYRVNDRGRAQRSVDTGRWIFNWIENDQTRFDVREKRIALRSLGRDITYGIFPTEITPAGIVVSRIPMPPRQESSPKRTARRTVRNEASS
jgi:hypothetical protein